MNRARVAELPVARLQSFSAHLRARGFTLGPSDTVAALRALSSADLADAREVKMRLRIVYARSPEEWARFDALFDGFFTPARPRMIPPPPPPGPDAPPSSFALPGPKFPDRPRPEPRAGFRLAYSPTWGERFTVSVLQGPELHAVRVTARRVAAVLPRRQSRRLGSRGRGELDLRRTVRAGIARAGDPVVLYERAPAPALPDAALVLDLSGSMREYGSFFITWAWALLRTRIRLHVFGFSTELRPLTPLLRGTRPGERPPGGLDQFSGGTRIGQALGALNGHYRERLFRHTTLMVVSDGFDAGDVELLGQAMRALRGRVGRLLWINPAATMPGYRPLATGIQAALPHVSDHLPVSDLPSLQRALAAGRFGGGPFPAPQPVPPL